MINPIYATCPYCKHVGTEENPHRQRYTDWKEAQRNGWYDLWCGNCELMFRSYKNVTQTKKIWRG